MAEINSFYKSKYTGEQLDRALDNIYDSVLVDGSKPMTGALTIKKADNGHARFDKDHTATADAGTVVEDVDKNGNTAAILLRGADKSAKLKLGATNYEMLHSGNIQPYIVPYAQTAEQAAEAAENALEGVREAIENIPEGTATPIVNDLTTGGASMALSAEMGKVLGQRPNPNLLDNWYFGNPVNQRGQTKYSGAVYTVDRWIIPTVGALCTVNDNGLTLTGDTNVGYLRQILEHSEIYYGKTFTISFVDTDGNLYQGSGVCPTVLPSATTTIAIAKKSGNTIYFEVHLHSVGLIRCQFRVPTGMSLSILAAKLELGTQQTLAHQDANGKWVLNEPPNYAEELAKCQRYQQVFCGEGDTFTTLFNGFSTNNTANFAIPLSVPMAKKPAIVYVNEAGVTSFECRCGGAQSSPSALNVVYTANTNVAALIATVSGFSANTACAFSTNGKRGILLDANL